MGSFGGRLQREREMRGISLDEIAEATKIGTRSLRALECGEFDKLPGGIFNKGFVRAYAKFLGIDEEQAVSDYMAALGEAEQASASAEASKPAAPKLMAPEEPVDEGSPAAAVAVLLAIVLVLAGLGYGGWRYYQQRAARAQARQAPVRQAPPLPASQASEPAAQPTTSAAPAHPAAADPHPVITAAADKQSVGAASDQKGFELLIRAREASWMSITADGKQVMSSMLEAGSEKSVRAHEKVIVKVGNAGGIEISYNGKPVAPVGDAGQTRTLTFTPTGLQQ